MKSIFKSRTFWKEALAFLAGVAMISGNPAAISVATIATDPNVQASAALILSSVTGIFLRTVTTQPVTITGETK